MIPLFTAMKHSVSWWRENWNQSSRLAHTSKNQIRFSTISAQTVEPIPNVVPHVTAFPMGFH